jgi:hypothetical protein
VDHGEQSELLLGEDRQHEIAVARAEPAGRRLPAHRAVADLTLLDADSGRAQARQDLRVARHIGGAECVDPRSEGEDLLAQI